MAFSSLLYTECRPERSVHGREGMQFQAVSPQANTEMEQVIVAHLLYRPSQKLMAADTAVSEHPLSFHYQRVRGHYYLGVGRYAGRDSRGREGNQLTHCLVTDDPGDIRPARPAQLFASGAWLSAASDSTQLASVSAPLRVADAYSPAALHAMACAQSEIVTFLPKLLTAFEEAAGTDRKKVVVSATDVDAAVRWIALAGLFLDPADVLELSFRVFTESPLAEDLSIAVFHPGLTRSPPSIETLPAALNGIDLDSLRTSPITPSPSALTYAHWFLDHDAFDALEAIELGRRWQRYLPSAAVATVMTGIACLNLPPGPGTGVVTIAQALAAISEHEPEDIDEYGGVLADAVTTVRPEATDDPRPLHRAALTLRRNHHHDAAEALTLALLEGMRLYPDTYGVHWSQAVADTDAADAVRARWTSDDSRRRAVELLSESLDAAQDRWLGALFTIIAGLGLGIRWASVDNAGTRLANYWAAHPDTVADRDRLAFAGDLHALLWRALEDRIVERDEGVRRAIAAGRWDWLSAHRDRYGSASSPLVAALTATTLAAAPPMRRAVLLREFLDTASAPDWFVFFPPQRPADAKLLAIWISAHPDVLHDPDFAGLVEAAIYQELSGGEATLLELIDERPGLAGPLADVTAKHARARAVLTAVRDNRFDDPNPALEDLLTIGGRFQDFYTINIAEYLILQADLVGVRRYLSRTRSYHLREHFYRRTTAQLQKDMPEFAHQLLYVCRSEETPPSMRTAVEDAFADWIRAPGNKKRALDAGGDLDRHNQELWHSFVQEVCADPAAPRPPRRLLSMRKFRKGGQR